MTFSERFEVTLKSAAIRHHDLSDLGRAVTAPMGIRGEPQAEVQQVYADVQDTIVRFLLARSGPSRRAFSEWLKMRDGAQYAVAVHPGIEPAPTAVRVLETVDLNTPAMLRAARLRDPQAPLFDAGNLVRIVAKAIGNGDFKTALDVTGFALEVHPNSAQLQEYRAAYSKRRGTQPGHWRAPPPAPRSSLEAIGRRLRPSPNAQRASRG